MECRFCNIKYKNYKYGRIDEPFIENNDFFAIASIGSMIEGWSLIIPKEHTFSMKNFYDKKEFADILNKIIPAMNEKYGKLIAFEHGSNIEGSITACGTDHAHFHIVPFGDSLVDDLLKSDLKWERCLLKDIKEKVIDKEYLFYLDEVENEFNNSLGFLHILDYPLSQYFRKVIAKRLGQLDKSDYKIFPFTENAEKTRNILSKFIA
ncbi:HIT family protein [Aliarcobacter butzleri]|uniref:HIT family protein n=1 Tax=Aliarcobacter butzleri TaxID=28197 RepID=UPI003B21688B